MSRPDGADAAADDEPVRDDEIQAEAQPGPDDLVEVEHEGRTYEVPAALTGALMRHADYTRKTQDLADHRRMLDAGHAALAELARQHDEHLIDHARLVGLDDQIGRLEQLNWPLLHQQSPAQAQQLMTQLFQMKHARDIAAGQLSHKQNVKAFEQQREHARQVEHAQAVAAREIDGWSPQRAAEVAQFALSQGVSPEELNALADPRLLKLLHHAYRGHQAGEQQAAAERLAQVQAVRPAVQVGGGGPGPQDPNRMSTEDWMRHRRGQVRRKAR